MHQTLSHVRSNSHSLFSLSLSHFLSISLSLCLSVSLSHSFLFSLPLTPSAPLHPTFDFLVCIWNSLCYWCTPFLLFLIIVFFVMLLCYSVQKILCKRKGNKEYIYMLVCNAIYIQLWSLWTRTCLCELYVYWCTLKWNKVQVREPYTFASFWWFVQTIGSLCLVLCCCTVSQKTVIVKVMEFNHGQIHITIWTWI